MSVEEPDDSAAVMDHEILVAFVDESDEALVEVVAQFVALESDPKNLESIDTIFRAVHTIKGNSAFFGLMKIKRLAHQMEDLMSLMRAGKATADKPIIDELLSGVDLLKHMLERVRDGILELEDAEQPQFDALLNKLEQLCNTKGGTEGPHWPSLLKKVEFIIGETDKQSVLEAAGELRAAILHASEAENAGADVDAGADSADEAVDPAQRLAEILAPEFHDGVMAEALSAEVLECLEQLKAASPADNEVRIALFDQAIQDYRSMTAEVGFVPMLREVLVEKLDEIRKLEGEQSPPAEAEGQPDERRQTARRAGDADPRGRSMRVDEAKIDEFLDYVGELIVVREMFNNVGKRLRDVQGQRRMATEFQQAMEAFAELSRDLQESIMAVRKVSVRTMLQKVPRIVRDITSKNGKNVRIEMSGESTAVDKSLVEAIEGPLVHMLRNAVDHGIETPDVREAAGKDAQGTLSLSVEEGPDEVLFVIRDDGAGINAPAVRAKAVKNGIITEAAAKSMSDEQSYQLLFAAGLSTAKQVTDVSGRGVGMDVVRRGVEELGGRIEIESELGAGTTFTIHLPKRVTVQILDGFIVRVADERYVFPLASISESFRPRQSEVQTIANRREFVSRHGRVLPLVRFSDVLRLGSEPATAWESIVVSMEVARQGITGFLVDEVLGVQQVVLRSLEGIDLPESPFSGGAILGDGRVSMVIDVERLSSLMN